MKTSAINDLIQRICEHRRNCKSWKSGDECFDCHNDTIGKIQQEIKENERNYVKLRKGEI